MGFLSAFLSLLKNLHVIQKGLSDSEKTKCLPQNYQLKTEHASGMLLFTLTKQDYLILYFCPG